MLFADLVATSDAVASTRARNAKVAALAELLGALEADEIVPAVAALSGAPRQGKVGVGWATAAIDGTASTPTLTIGDLDRFLDELAATSGAGSQGRRRGLLDDFGARAMPAEADFMRRLFLGELRQGALAGIVADAVSKASGVAAPKVRRAAMLTGDLARTAELALVGGAEAIESVGLEVGTAVQPMLASTATDVAEAIAAAGDSSVEWKLDGARVQAHRRGDEVRLFTRNLNDITDRLPALVDDLRRLDVESIILDGEALGVGDDGLPVAFQDSMSQLSRSGGEEARGAVEGEPEPKRRGHQGLSALWFDVLHLDGVDLIDEPLTARRRVMGSIVGLDRIPSIETADPAAAQRVLDESLAAGHEGVMVKALGSTYAAGRRGAEWRKVKPVHTLDLVVLAVEWGSGRRRGWLSNLHLGALGPDGTPVMVGKTFKGMTDTILEWQTARFLELETHRDGHVVYVRPEQVVEIALDGAQASTRYPGGVALRFARVRRYRDDKSAAETDTLDAVRELLPRSRR